MRKSFSGIAAAAAFALAPATAADWRVVDLGSPHAQAGMVDVGAISDRGEIAGGTWLGSSTITHYAFAHGRGAFELFGETTQAPPAIAKDVNRSGLVVGGDGRAFLYDGTLARIPGLNGSSIANAVNERGEVVGEGFGPDGYRGFRYAAGQLRWLGTLGGATSQAYGINRAGDIVGTAHTAFTASGGDFGHAFLLSRDGIMRDLGTLGGKGSVAYAINNRGEVAGASLTPGNAAKHAFLYRDGAMLDLGTLPGLQGSDAVGINDRGEVVGISMGFDGTAFVERPFLWREGRMIDLAALPELAEAGFTSWVVRGHQVGDSSSVGPGIAINHHGDIVGVGLKEGRERVFVLSPMGARR